MRFKIESTPNAGLRVMSEVPDGELVQIDGRNGVGKTLAVRLLQLVTTSQPFADRPQSWLTLKDNLNPVTIWAEGLRDGKVLRFELDPDDWPSEPSPPGDWLGSVYLNNQRISWSEVPTILRVRRIGGDETLGESLAAQVATDAELIRQTLAQQGSKRHDWNERLGALRILTDMSDAFDLPRLRSAVQMSVRRISKTTTQFEAAKQRADQIGEIERTATRLKAVTEMRPALTRRVADLTSKEAALRAAANDLDERAAEVLTQSKQNAEVWTQVNHLTGLQRKRRERRERRRRELAELCRAANVSIPVDFAAAQEHIRSLRANRDELEDERQTVDRAGLVLELLDAIEGPIDRGLAASLTDEIVAQLPAGPVNVGELGRGLSARRDVLEKIERSAGDKILTTITRIDRQLAACINLPDAVRLMERADADLDSTEEELAQYLHTLTGRVASDYEAINEQRVQRLDELTKTIEERAQAEAELLELLGDGDEIHLRSLARDQLLALGTTADPQDSNIWAGFKEDVLRELAETTAILSDATEKHDHAQAQLVQAESAVRGATVELRKNPRYKWLDVEGLAVPRVKSSLDEQLDTLRAIRRGVSSVDELLLRTLNDQQSLERALSGLETRLRASGTAGQLEAGQRGEFSARVETYYQQRFAAELSTDMVRAALFSDGSDIDVDLRTMSTSWTLPNGQRNTRPLEAFSSGERAFAYTRVQVERLAEDRAENRVIFLDEFGSFVAHDRFEELKRFLKAQALGKAADKIVLILPLRRAPSQVEERELSQRGGYLVSEIN